MSLPAQAPQDTGQDGTVPIMFLCPCMCLHPSVPAGPCPVRPSPARSAELQPFPRSGNQPGGSSGRAAASWAAQGRSQPPLARGHPWG